jgi:type III restriction enzyme
VKPLKIQFDRNQAHQIEAINSLVQLFEGLFRADTEAYELGDEITPNIPSYFQFDRGWLEENLSAVQQENGIAESLSVDVDSGFLLESVRVDTWEYPAFTIDMETGTGKTYVYLRTIYELNSHYGFRKFIIVVPSVAIYEGVVKNFEITREHFKALYGNVNATLYRYDGAKPALLKNFAVGQDIEVMVMTIDSFNKKSNTIFKKTDKLMGERYPYEYLQDTRPILILDESQNYRSEKSRAALRTLKPLFAINYSATPGTDAPNIVYKLSPFDAFKRSLVKKIEVLGMIEGQSVGLAEDYLRLIGIEKDGGKLTARFDAMVDVDGGFQAREITVTGKTDLQTATRNPSYAGWKVEEISQKEQFVQFGNGERFGVEDERLLSVSKEALFRRQIEETIKFHIAKQRELEPHGVKVLSLFFVDRVANYVDADGMIKRLFDQAFESLKGRSSHFQSRSAEEVREGYFAKKKAMKKQAEQWVDTSFLDEKKTQAEKELEKEAYELIMKKKERLLSFDEPVSFIFAHSALREGWDNPNVFQICALREIWSEQQRRQTIGRGLRLPVTQQGSRLEDRRLNVLTVVANESYANYVARLQKEYEETGDMLPAVPADASAKEVATRNGRVYQSNDFHNFWSKLIQRTEYRITVDTEDLVKQCIAKLNNAVYPEPHIVVTRGRYVVTNYQIGLLEVQSGEAKLRIAKDSTDGESESFESFVQAGTDLAKAKNDPVLKPFKIVEISGEGLAGRVVFSEGGELSVDKSIIFSSEQGQSFSTRKVKEETGDLPKFNLIARTCREVSLTRATVLSIFKGLRQEHKQAFISNPEGFAAVFIGTIKEAVADHIAEKLEYVATGELLPRSSEAYFPESKTFPAKELIAGNGDASVYDFVQVDSENERRFVERINDDGKVILYFKFPATFKIRIPRIIGNYNPDWGILRWDDQHRLKLELVRETKGNIDLAMLQHSNEGRKIRCARRHFGSLGISYRHVTADTTDWWKEEVREDDSQLFNSPRR